jgi:hypothetical protein
MATLFTRKRMAPAILLGGLLLLLSACGGDREPPAALRPERASVELSATVDRAVVNPGDVITFTLTADYRSDILLELPEIADKFSDFRIANSGVVQPARKGDRLVAERWYKLQADIAGSYVIEPIEVAYSLQHGKRRTAKTPKIFLEVESLLAKQGEAHDIRDIKPPVSVSPSYGAFLLVLAILAGTIALLLLSRKLFNRLRSRAEAKRFAPKPAHEEALEALDRLLKKRLVEKGHARLFCFEISEIFRRYMQARFGIPALDLTTDEILPRVEGNGIIGERLKPVVREFLTDTDFVKFAKYQPTRDEIEKIIENTRAFINISRAVPAAGAASAVGGEAS